MRFTFRRGPKPLKPARPQRLRETEDAEARMSAARLAVSVNRRLGYDTTQELKDIADGREWDPAGWARRHPDRAEETNGPADADSPRVS